MNIADVAQHVHALEQKVKEQADEIERLRQALSDLLGVQNGPPLVTWTEEWNAAILKAEAALKGDE
jgi:hypothetical protein